MVKEIFVKKAVFFVVIFFKKQPIRGRKAYQNLTKSFAIFCQLLFFYILENDEGYF